MTDDALQAAGARLAATLAGRADPQAACVTVARGVGPGRLLEAFGAEPGQEPVPRDRMPAGLPAVAVVEVPGGVVAVEDDGRQGITGAVLRRLSTGGRAGACCWSERADLVLSLARAGTVLDGPGDGPVSGWLGDDPEARALMAGLGDPEEWLADIELRAVLALERFTGVGLAAAAAAGSAPVYPLLARLEDHWTVPPEFAASMWIPGARAVPGADELLHRLLAADTALLRRTAAWAARAVLARAGMIGHPDLAETVATLGLSGGPLFGPAADVLVRRHLQAPTAATPGPAAAALRALHAATNPDPFTAALRATACAFGALPRAERDGFVRAALCAVRAD